MNDPKKEKIEPIKTEIITIDEISCNSNGIYFFEPQSSNITATTNIEQMSKY